MDDDAVTADNEDGRDRLQRVENCCEDGVGLFRTARQVRIKVAKR